MPELPEVESAARRLRRAIVGKRIETRRPAAPLAAAPAQAGPAAVAARRARSRRGSPRQAPADLARRRANVARALSHDRRLDDRSLERSAAALRARGDRVRRRHARGPRRSARAEHAGSSRVGIAAVARARPRADRSLTHRADLRRRALQASRTDQAGAARPARHRRHRQHLRGGVALARPHLADGRRVVALDPPSRRAPLRAPTGDSPSDGCAVHGRLDGAARRVRSEKGSRAGDAGRRFGRIVQAGRSTYYCPAAASDDGLPA